MHHLRQARNQTICYTQCLSTFRPIERAPVYKHILRYVAGCCTLNEKLSHRLPLDDTEEAMMHGLQEAQCLVHPLQQDMWLYHGFEYMTRYNERTWQKGQIVHFDHVLSKTLDFNVARVFASNYGTWSCFLRKYMLVHYKAGSRHIVPDMPIKFVGQMKEWMGGIESEYEFMRIGDCLRLIDIVNEWHLFHVDRFYIFEDVANHIDPS